jgi:hypothetical protein
MFTCEHCSTQVKGIVIHGSQLWCRPCHYGATPENKSAYVVTDEIPGGIEIKHGICNEDGTPKRYYSKSEIKRAAYEKNLFIVGDTPKPNHRVADSNAQNKQSKAERQKRGSY